MSTPKSEKAKRDFNSLHWLKISKLKRPFMIGWGWSSDWLTLLPWTMEGVPQPYIGIRYPAREGSPMHYVVVYLGPLMIQYARLKKDLYRKAKEDAQ